MLIPIWNRQVTSTDDKWKSSQTKRYHYFNLLTPNDDYSGRTAPLPSKRCILYIYSTHIGTEYVKHGIYSTVFSLQNAVCFIILTYLVPGLFTFYIKGVLKFKKNNSGAKRLINRASSYTLFVIPSRETLVKTTKPHYLTLWQLKAIKITCLLVRT